MPFLTGNDLTKLIVGSEGTLGVITEAILRLIPRPPASQTMMAAFPNLVQSGRAVSKILSSGILPSKIELLDQASIQAVEDYQSIGLPTDAQAVLLIELDGHPEAITDETVQVKQIIEHLEAFDIQIAETAEDAQKLWAARKLVSPAIVRKKPTKISEDATVPRSQIPAFFERLQTIQETYDVDLVVFGHAGDGNLHPNVICDKRDDEEMERVEKAVEEIFAAAIDLGGTLSGEHGIGTMKSPFMAAELGDVGLDMMKRIKEAWDPNNILNPGKIFPEPGQKLVLRE